MKILFTWNSIKVLLDKGIVEEKVPFRREFIAEYRISKTRSIFVEGYYLRKPSGEKCMVVITMLSI